MRLLIISFAMLTAMVVAPVYAEDDCDCGPEPIRRPADPAPPEPE